MHRPTAFCQSQRIELRQNTFFEPDIEASTHGFKAQGTLFVHLQSAPFVLFALRRCPPVHFCVAVHTALIQDAPRWYLPTAFASGHKSSVGKSPINRCTLQHHSQLRQRSSATSLAQRSDFLHHLVSTAHFVSLSFRCFNHQHDSCTIKSGWLRYGCLPPFCLMLITVN